MYLLLALPYASQNPDVFELIRAKCNKLQNLPSQINSIITNLPSGYHRDLQIIKRRFFTSFETIKSCLEMTKCDVTKHHHKR